MPSRPREPVPEDDNLSTLAQMYAAHARPPRGALWSKEIGRVKRTAEESIKRHEGRGSIGAVRAAWAAGKSG